MTFPWSAGSGGGGWRLAVASGGCGQRWAASPLRAELGSARRPRRRAPGECSGCRRDRRQAVPLTGGGFSGRGGGPRPNAGGGAAGRAGTRALSALGNGRRVSTSAARARGGGWAGPGRAAASGQPKQRLRCPGSEGAELWGSSGSPGSPRHRDRTRPARCLAVGCGELWRHRGKSRGWARI